jgi:hypothetical protein
MITNMEIKGLLRNREIGGAAMSRPVFCFAGGRSLPSSWAPFVRSVLARVAAVGGGVAVGCASGADALAGRLALEAGLPLFVACAWPRSRAPRWVLAAEAAGAVVRFGCGGPCAGVSPGRVLARRTAWLVRVVSRRPGSWLVALPGGRGTALACRVASSLGLPVWRVAVLAARVRRFRRCRVAPGPLAFVRLAGWRCRAVPGSPLRAPGSPVWPLSSSAA